MSGGLVDTDELRGLAESCLDCCHEENQVAVRSALFVAADELDRLRGERDTLRELLAEALPTIEALAEAHGFSGDSDDAARIRAALAGALS